jgi:hypothetical protein
MIQTCLANVNDSSITRLEYDKVCHRLRIRQSPFHQVFATSPRQASPKGMMAENFSVEAPASFVTDLPIVAFWRGTIATRLRRNL